MGNTLVILAAGKSSRFGGYPKAFCRLGEQTNVENTLRLAQRLFSKIYIVVNEETYRSDLPKTLGTEVISIVTGQGDADSLLKALTFIHAKDPLAHTVMLCWGDAVFFDAEPFSDMLNHAAQWETPSPALVGCCMDRDPYAWFDTDGTMIRCSNFRAQGSKCQQGLHDQSIFMFRTGQIIAYLERFKKYLGLDQYDPHTYDAARGEMRLLDAFTYFYELPDLIPAEYRLLTEGKVRSFNTPEELQIVAEELQIFRNYGRRPCLKS